MAGGTQVSRRSTSLQPTAVCAASSGTRHADRQAASTPTGGASALDTFEVGAIAPRGERAIPSAIAVVPHAPRAAASRTVPVHSVHHVNEHATVAPAVAASRPSACSTAAAGKGRLQATSVSASPRPARASSCHRVATSAHSKARTTTHAADGTASAALAFADIGVTTTAVAARNAARNGRATDTADARCTAVTNSTATAADGTHHRHSSGDHRVARITTATASTADATATVAHSGSIAQCNAAATTSGSPSDAPTSTGRGGNHPCGQRSLTSTHSSTTDDATTADHGASNATAKPAAAGTSAEIVAATVGRRQPSNSATAIITAIAATPHHSGRNSGATATRAATTKAACRLPTHCGASRGPGASRVTAEAMNSTASGQAGHSPHAAAIASVSTTRMPGNTDVRTPAARRGQGIRVLTTAVSATAAATSAICSARGVTTSSRPPCHAGSVADAA